MGKQNSSPVGGEGPHDEPSAPRWRELTVEETVALLEKDTCIEGQFSDDGEKWHFDETSIIQPGGERPFVRVQASGHLACYKRFRVKVTGARHNRIFAEDARHSEGLRKLAELMKEYNMHFLHDADALTIESAGDSRTFYTTDGFFTEDNIEGEEL